MRTRNPKDCAPLKSFLLWVMRWLAEAATASSRKISSSGSESVGLHVKKISWCRATAQMSCKNRWISEGLNPGTMPGLRRTSSYSRTAATETDIERLRQNMANVNLSPVVVDGGNEAHFVPADVEHREFSHLVGMGKNLAKGLDVREPTPLHFKKPLRQSSAAIGMQSREVVQALHAPLLLAHLESFFPTNARYPFRVYLEALPTQ